MDELARRAELSIDTIRFYQKRRLLDPPEREGRVAWYAPEHLDRLACIRDLQRRGFSLALIGRVVRGEMDPTDTPLAAAVVAAGAPAQDPDDGLLTIDDLAARTGVERPLLDAIVGEGLLAPKSSDGEPLFTAADVAIVRAGLQLVSAGLPVPELLALARDHHEATSTTAERAVAMFDEHVRTPLRDADLSDDEKAGLLVDAFDALLPAITTLVTHHFRQVLLTVAQQHLEKTGAADVLSAARVETDRLAAAGGQT